MVLLDRLTDSAAVVTGAVVGLGARSPAGALGFREPNPLSSLALHAAPTLAPLTALPPKGIVAASNRRAT
jgi:hypothetical protein